MTTPVSEMLSDVLTALRLVGTGQCQPGSEDELVREALGMLHMLVQRLRHEEQLAQLRAEQLAVPSRQFDAERTTAELLERLK